ncbi:PREDICTED: UDP-glycosyltransferase 87A1-like [Ipomoea nil]|uniref:UDP-glycosyltransferase 87A1-like n=1 Tax=Ipomoea nil TaxID=35883 RepID=UPI000901FDED|nr:PREDICTED: UDP-glycosyltransferase 87A1-like [Ipomoea nil]
MADQKFSHQIVAIPFPGRGHINPLMNLCKIIAMAKPQVLITFVVTEEWHGLLSSDAAMPVNVRFGCIPDVLPSELIRSKDYPCFIRAVFTDMEAPVDRLLDAVEAPAASVIISDVFLLTWVLGVGNRRNIPVACFWCGSVTMFSLWFHHRLLLVNGHFDANLSEKGDEVVDYIPGVSSMLVKDLPPLFHGKPPGPAVRSLLLGSFSAAQRAQYLLFTSIAELETAAIEALRPKLQTSIYSIGSAIPYFYTDQTYPDYLTWLDAQPARSVLYISQGSFLSLSAEQMEEIVAGVHDSGVRFFWVARENTQRLRERERGGGGKQLGLIVAWCDQLRVLRHRSVGGFWTHCGWNSIKEGAFAGVPFLAFPIALDQLTNSKQIVEDWKIGWSVVRKNNDDDDGGIVKRGEIAQLVRRFMECGCDNNNESKELRRRANQIGEMCRESTEGGLAKHDLQTFIEDVLGTGK